MSTPIHTAEVDEKVDIRKYLVVLRRRAWWGVIPFTILVAVFTVICLAVPDKFLSHCTIKASKSEVLKLLEGDGTVKATASSTIINERITTYDFVMTALAETDLMGDVDIRADANPDDRGRLEDELHQRIVKNLSLDELGNSKVLMRVSYLGDTPDHAVDVLRRLVGHFVENALKEEQTSARAARELAIKTRGKAKEALTSVESKIVSFQQDHPGVNTEGESGKFGRLADTELFLRQIDHQIVSGQRQLTTYTEQVQGMPAQIIAEVTNKQNTEVQLYRTRLADLRVALARTLKAYTPLHPTVKMLQQQVEAVEEELARARRQALEEDEVKLVRNKLLDDLKAKKLELEAKLDGLQEMRRGANASKLRLEEEVAAYPNLQYQLAKLEREQQIAETADADALAQFRRVDEEFDKMVEGLVSFSVIRPARRPHTKDTKHVVKLAMLGLLISVAAGFGAIAGTEFLDQSFTDVDAARDFLRLPSLGVIPYIQTRRDRRGRRIKLGVIFGTIVVAALSIAAGMYFTKSYRVVWEWIEELCKNLV